ncbi:MAG: 6-carboxytetrahydropterin synthase [Desulfobaccales bacterium]
MNELPAFSHQNPYSENLVSYLFQRLGDILNRDGVKVSRVNVWESDNSCASYCQD